MNRAAYLLYLVVLLVSPFLFGAVHTYAYTFMMAGTLLATFCVLCSQISSKQDSQVRYLQIPISGFNFGFVSILIFLFLQTIPLPPAFLKFLTPSAFETAVMALPTDGSPVPHFATALYTYPVRNSIVRFTVYGLFFLGFSQTLNSRKRITRTIVILLLLGTCEALYALSQHNVHGRILWFPKKILSGDIIYATGTYINRNHFAGLMEMLIILAMGALMGLNQILSKKLLLLLSATVMGLGLMASGSRGGLIAVVVGLIFLGLILSFKKKERGKSKIIFVLILMTIFFTGADSFRSTLERFQTLDLTMLPRLRFINSSMDIFKDYKLCGVGVGNFRYVFPHYQDQLDQKKNVRYAHNDWIQFLVEAGVVGFSLLLIGITLFFKRSLHLWKRRHDSFAVCLWAASVASIVTMGLHACFDFNLHIPANFLMLMGIMAIGNSALHQQRTRKMLYRYYKLPLHTLTLCVTFMFLTGYWTLSHFMAETYCNTVTNSTLNRDADPSLRKIAMAINWDQQNATYHYKMAVGLLKKFQSVPHNDTKRKKLLASAINSLETAAILNPWERHYYLLLTHLYLTN